MASQKSKLRRLRNRRIAWSNLHTTLPAAEVLEARLLLAVDVTTYHNDIASTGQNLNETQLTRANVNSTTFGKLFSYQVDGQVYAQPLIKTGVNITTGPNQGLHDVVFVATEHDSLYALDASNTGGQLLWQRSLLDTFLPGATSVIPEPGSDTGSSDVSVEIGITGTPVIDPSTNTLYVVTDSRETVAGVNHYVQRLFAVNLSDGTNKVAPFVIGDTSGLNTNTTQVYAYSNGYGDGHVTDPYNNTGKQVVQFNARTEFQRPALTELNGVIYVGWASHGDNGPYHGWIVGFDTSTLAIRNVFCVTPSGGGGGIWQSGGQISSDGTNLYFQTGNGTFDGNNGSDPINNPVQPAPGPVTGLDANGFPVNGDYGDSFIKLSIDNTTSPTNQNINGWGIKVADYFTPFNQLNLTNHDTDLGSGAPVILPTSVGSLNHPNLLVGAGKQGTLYVVDRNNMGKFGVGDNVVQEIGGALSGSLDTAAYYNNTLYYVEGYGGNAKTFSIANGQVGVTPTSRSTDSFAFAGSTPSITANAGSNGIAWDVDRGTNQLRAYSTDSYATELYTSNQASGGRDALGAAVKFEVPTVANGHVYVASGTGNPNNFLVVYGLIQPPVSSPLPPSNLAALPVSGSQVNLSWIDHDVAPNTADGYAIEQSPDGNAWTQIATTGPGVSSYPVGNLNTGQTYYFRVRAFNAIGYSTYSNPASAVPSGQTSVIAFPYGFVNLPAGTFVFNGGATNSGSTLQLTDGGQYEARSVFSANPVDITNFSTTFTFQNTAGAGTGDGMTFVFQGVGNTAVGSAGGGLGYGTDGVNAGNSIGKSLAVKFDLYNNQGEGSDSTGVYTNGLPPSAPAIDMTGIVDLHSGDLMKATISYDGNNLVETLTDTVTGSIFSHTYTGYSILGLVGATTAYVGFTGSTGGATSTQSIQSWTYSPASASPPAIPQNIAGVLTGYTAGSTTAVPLGTNVSWNDVAGETGFKLERSAIDDQHFTQIATLAQGATRFADRGLATQTTYYYRVRASNNVGDGAYSSEITITTPALAPTPNNSQINTVTTNSIAFSWADNASNEDGFQIFRSVNSGPFSLLKTLPPGTNPAPSRVSYTDLNLFPGARYDYHVQAFNLAGYSDFAGVTSYTVNLAPTSLLAFGSIGAISLKWTAPGSNVSSYNIYRSTTSGQEGTTPYQTGVTGATFTDSNLPPGVTYYYTVAALNGGGLSAASGEVFSSTNPAAVVSFVKNDITTQGNWKSAYGAEGSYVVLDPSSNNPSIPSYATIKTNGIINYTWAASTSQVRALQKSAVGSNDRIAGVWYAGNTESVDIQMSDGNTHQIAIYALDWDYNNARSERVDVIDDATGTLLDSENLATFQNGAYLVWNIKGSVTLKVTNTGGANSNVVLNGLFFGGAQSTTTAPPPPPAATVNFVQTNSITQGNWKAIYGTDGSDVALDPSSNNPTIPAYASVNISGATPYTWAASTAQVRALQKTAAGSTDRIASSWYAGTSESIDVQLTDGNTHLIALYALDWDTNGLRSERIDVIDDASGSVLDSRSIATFQNGAYLVWNVKGSVTFKLTNTGGTATTAVFSGLFFGSNGSTPTPPSNTPAASVGYVQTDTTTQGTWKPVYGADGSYMAADQSANNPTMPAYASVKVSGATLYTWASSTTQIRALQKTAVGSTDRIASTWYAGSSESVDVKMTDGKTHQVALYVLDWDTNGARAERINVIDDATGTVLDSRPIATFQNGAYLVWNVNGSVTFTITNTGQSPSNAVFSGLFFGAVPAQLTTSASFTKLDATTQGNWIGAYGADGYNVSQDPSLNNPNIPSYAAISTFGASSYLWAGSTTQANALRKSAPGATDRVAGVWYSTTTESFDVRINDGKTHQVAIYALDYDTNGARSERVDLINDLTGAVIDTHTLSNFQNGSYLVYNLSGYVTIRVTNLAPTTSAGLSGIFFGPAT